MSNQLNRRSVVKLCASAAALVGACPEVLAGQGATERRPKRVKLVDRAGRALRADDLMVGINYLFHYPYVSTPCFLLNLGRPTASRVSLRTEEGRHYDWQSGVGRQHAVVAFSTICAHKMSHLAQTVSFINYRHEPVNFRDEGERLRERAQVIYCCSEKSVYDPLRGARVMARTGPATAGGGVA
jgi:arsenite oxidase small subunit